MNTFVDAVVNQEARTENGMKARKSAANACVDLFYKAGASRGKNIVGEFVAALVEDEDIAIAPLPLKAILPLKVLVPATV